jgi:hypothetical protein
LENSWGDACGRTGPHLPSVHVRGANSSGSAGDAQVHFVHRDGSAEHSSNGSSKRVHFPAVLLSVVVCAACCASLANMPLAGVWLTACVPGLLSPGRSPSAAIGLPVPGRACWSAASPAADADVALLFTVNWCCACCHTSHAAALGSSSSMWRYTSSLRRAWSESRHAYSPASAMTPH